MNRSITYSDAGVSIDEANKAKERIKRLARATFNERALTEIGSFGGMFDAAFPDMRKPVLVASADGVGTKLKVAFATGIHNTIGLDLVNHCTNDILVQGARPLFFLDYIATGKLAPDAITSIVEGLARGCRENSCVLLGGETAEMPGFYADGEYDVAGFIVGIVDREKVIDGKRIEAGDSLLALPSSGLHTNGYSLARKLFFEIARYDIHTHLDELSATVGEALLAPHKSYLPALAPLLDANLIRGLAHITGGGLLENIPRILPEGTSVEIARGAWTVPPVFSVMQRIGNVSEVEMYRTFNMGVGMAVICAQADKQSITERVNEVGEECFEIGRVVEGAKQVLLI
ncbi:MAG: phosphoribosylformylglycinamidine cyclo-ligase [Pyrinomonadaceae bacterium]|nr:phosphoribosylformylglycinamidine cyclo-ligase [Pyrinomonadaceae bacterium]